MSWLVRYRARSFLRSSVWIPPLAGMIAALVAHPGIRRLDVALGWKAAVSVDGARAVLGALASSMLTFIVFVFSIQLVAVQLASAQFAPRIIALVYRDRVLKWSFTLFVFTFTFTLAELGRIDDFVPQLSLWIAIYGSVFCIALFVYMIDHVGKALLPVSLLTTIGSLGQEVIRQVYPRPVARTADTLTNVPLATRSEPERIVESGSTGVVLAFDQGGLVALARTGGCAVELVPPVGQFVGRSGQLFRLPVAVRSSPIVACGSASRSGRSPRFARRDACIRGIGLRTLYDKLKQHALE